MFWFLAVAFWTLISSATLVHADKKDDALKAISNAADRICSLPDTKPTERRAPRQNREISSIQRELTTLARQLDRLGLAKVDPKDLEMYAFVLEKDLLSVTGSSSMAGSPRDCKLQVFGSLVDRMLIPVDVAPQNKCRIQINGVERYQREFDVTRDSGWRGGGYTQVRWCNDLVSILAGQYPGGRIERIRSSEDTRNVCPPFNCPQYNYYCSVHVSTDPIYIEAASPLCADRK